MSIHEYNVVLRARLSRGESESLACKTKYNVGFANGVWLVTRL